VRTHRIVTVATAAMLLFGVTAHAREMWERHWIEARTENFVVVSTLGKGWTLALARRLESFRELIAVITSPERVDVGGPIKVYLFRWPFPEIGLSRDLGGYFLPTAQSSIIVLRYSPNMPEGIQHEYVHALFRNLMSRAYPSWVNEGVAEMLSTVDVEGASFDVGKPPHDAAIYLSGWRWLEFSQVLAIHDPLVLKGVQRSMFYYQSWLLIHYLNWGRLQRPFSADTTNYLRRMETGEAPDAAFSESFDLEIADLAPVLREYWSRLSYLKSTLDAPDAAAEVALREMQPAEVAAGIGEILLERGQLASGRRYLDAAQSLQSGSADTRAAIAEER